jgi:uncharacterized protein with FMN-binding domain
MKRAKLARPQEPQLRRVTAALLAALLLLPPGSAALAAGPGESAAVGALPAGSYSVPIEFYREHYLTALGNSPSVQYEDRALVKSDGGGRYEVTLRYNSHSVVDAIQVFRPDKMAEADALLAEMGKTSRNNLPAGTFGLPEETAAALEERGLASGDYDEYYIQGTERRGGAAGSLDEAMDIGYFTFAVAASDFSELWVKSCSIVFHDNRYSTDEILVEYSMMFRPDLAAALPDSLTLEAGASADLAWAWTNTMSVKPSNVHSSWTRGGSRDLLEGGVSVAADGEGRLKATFTLKADAGVTAVARATQRAIPATLKRYYLNEGSGTAWEPVDITDGTFTLDYESLAFGVYLQIWSADSATNAFYGWLRLEPAAATLKEKGSEAGVKLVYASSAMPDSYVFAASKHRSYDETLEGRIREDKFLGAMARAGNDADAGFYSVSLLDAAGNPAQGNVTLRFPIPADWDADKLWVERWTDINNTSPNLGFTVADDGDGNRTVDVGTGGVKGLNALYFVGEQPDSADLAALAPGLYRASVALMHYSEKKLSMGSSGIVNEAYVEVKAGQDPVIYLEGHYVSTSGNLQGYLSNIYQGGEEAAYLGHFTDEEIIANDLENGVSFALHEYYQIEYPKRMALALRAPAADGSPYPGAYAVEIKIPLMAAIGSGGTQNAYLIITSAEAAGENPLAGYDRTVLTAAIDAAGRLLASARVKTDEARALLASALEEAGATLGALTAERSDAYKSAADRLYSQMGAALGGAVPGPGPSALYKAGTYSGVGQGYAGNGDAGVEVFVTVDENSILRIEAGAHRQTATLFAKAFTEGGIGVNSEQAVASVPAQILANQSVIDVDAVSGATLSSRGVEEAVAAALVKANAALQEEEGPPAASKAALDAAIAAAEALDGEGYTAGSWAALLGALAAAKAVSGDDEAAQASVDGALNALNAALAALEGRPAGPQGADTAALEAAVAAAKGIAEGGWAAGSYEALAAATAAAEALLAGDPSESQVAARLAALEAETAALAPEDALAAGPADGTYSLAGRTYMQNYSTGGASMSEAAVDHSQSYLEVKGGKARAHLFFGPVTIGVAGFTGYLKNFYRIVEGPGGFPDDYALAEATYHSYHDVVDEFNEGAEWSYPREVSIEVAPGEAYTKAYVNVPAMGAAAEQAVLLKIDWDGLDLSGLDADGLDAALAEAAAAGLTDCTAESRAALAASVAAGNALISLEGATQAMFDSRAAAIAAAIEALVPLGQGVGPEDPEEPGGGVAVSLHGPAKARAGGDAVYHLSVSGAERLSILEFTFDSAGLTLGGVEAAEGFAVLSSTGNSVCLMAANGQGGFTAAGGATVAALTFKAGAAGAAAVTIGAVEAWSYASAGSSDSDETRVALAQASVRTEIEGAAQYDRADVNEDGAVNLGDLSTAAWYYRLTDSSPLWDGRAAKADRNGDGLIDLGDLIEVYGAVKAAA